MARNALALLSDEKLFPAAVFLAWKLSRLNPRSDTDIVLVSDWKPGFAEAKALVPDLVLIDCDFDDTDYGKHQPTYWEKFSYHRMCLPRLLPHTDRIFYIDIDMFVASPAVFGLFDLDMKGMEIGAVRAIDYFRLKAFNGGAILLDAAAYRRNGREEQAFNLIRSKDKLSFANREQQILNELFRKKWLELSPSFNFVSRWMHTELAQAFSPEILHFIGPLKHWTTPSVAENHPALIELKDFLAGTSWSGFVGSIKGDPNHFDQLLPSMAAFGPKLPGLIKFLRTAEFADVVQGITRPRFELLPSV